MNEFARTSKPDLPLARVRQTVITIGLLVLCVSTLRADQIAVPNQFQAGATARAAEVNANFDALVAESNAQDLRLESIEADAADTASQLSTIDTRVAALETGGASYTRIEEPRTLAAGEALQIDVTCPSGLAISGGMVSGSRFTVMTGSYTDLTMNTWSIRVDNRASASRSVTAFAICAE